LMPLLLKLSLLNASSPTLNIIITLKASSRQESLALRFYWLCRRVRQQIHTPALRIFVRKSHTIRRENKLDFRIEFPLELLKTLLEVDISWRMKGPNVVVTAWKAA
jgi:hypothetical protein